MRLTVLLIVCLSVIPASAQDDDCKKLTSKKTGASGNDCCKETALEADNALLAVHKGSKNLSIRMHAPFGVPKSKNKNIHILYSKNYICGYDTVFHVPIWVQYKLLSEKYWDENMKRQDCFRIDPRLSPAEQIKHSDYTRSGFDRGHLKPANDSKGDLDDHLNSFVMTNMAPQYPNMNRKEWMAIECYINALSRKDSISAAYIITGSVVDEQPDWIKDKIAIPSWFYKIYFFKTSSGRWEFWVFYVKNDNIKSDIRDFEKELKDNVKSIDEIEKLTQTNFFVSRKGQKAIEKKKYTYHLKEGMFSFGYSSSYITKL